MCFVNIKYSCSYKACTYHRRRNWGGRGARASPIFHPQDFINIHQEIHTCSGDRRVTVYITFGPPKMESLPTPMHIRSCPSWKLSASNIKEEYCSISIPDCYINLNKQLHIAVHIGKFLPSIFHAFVTHVTETDQ